MKGYRIVFIRHGVTEANLKGFYIGKTDLPLAPQGIGELYDKIENKNYRNVQKIYSSPMKRCTATASLIYPDRFIEIVPDLREMDFGDFEGKSAEELMNTEEYKTFIKGGLDNPPPNGESMRSVVERCYNAIEYIISDMMNQGLTNCAVVTHGGVIMNMLSCFGLPKMKPIEIACDFGEGFEVLVSAQMWQQSKAFEILGRFPYENDSEEDY